MPIDFGWRLWWLVRDGALRLRQERSAQGARWERVWVRVVQVAAWGKAGALRLRQERSAQGAGGDGSGFGLLRRRLA